MFRQLATSQVVQILRRLHAAVTTLGPGDGVAQAQEDAPRGQHNRAEGAQRTSAGAPPPTGPCDAGTRMILANKD